MGGRSATRMLVLLLGCAAPAAPEEHHRGYATVQVGSARTHEWDRSASWMEARGGWVFLPSGVAAADLGLGWGQSGEGFLSLTAGLELRPWPRARLSPFLRGEVGLFGEPEYSGYVAGLGGGLALRLGSRWSLRAGAAWNAHGGATGPVTYYGGLQARF